jgi:hypothetical protein
VGEEIKSIGLLVNVTGQASAGLKPLPEMLTVVVLIREDKLGLTVILGANCTTTNVAVAKSPLLPLTWIVCAPNAVVVESTVNVVETSFPPDIVHVGELTMSGSGVLVISDGQLAASSAVLKPLPVIVTTVPAVPEPGVRVICGPVTVNEAVAKSPVGTPVTVSE